MLDKKNITLKEKSKDINKAKGMNKSEKKVIPNNKKKRE